MGRTLYGGLHGPKPLTPLGVRIDRARAGEITLAELARRTGYSKAYMTLIRRNVCPNIGVFTLKVIADALGVSPCWLAYGCEHKEKDDAQNPHAG